MNAAALKRPPGRSLWMVPSPWLVPLCIALIAGAVHACTDLDAWRVCVVVLLAPLLEEVLFRAGIQAELAPLLRSEHRANAAASVLFSLAHGCLVGLAHGIAVLLPSLMLGECYRRCRHVAPCALLHSAMNAAWLLGLNEVWAAGLTLLLLPFATA